MCKGGTKERFGPLWEVVFRKLKEVGSRGLCHLIDLVKTYQLKNFEGL